MKILCYKISRKNKELLRLFSGVPRYFRRLESRPKGLSTMHCEHLSPVAMLFNGQSETSIIAIDASECFLFNNPGFIIDVLYSYF